MDDYNHREHHVLPIDHPISVENVRRHISSSKKMDDVFNKDELDDIWHRAFDERKLVRLNKNGTVIICGQLDEIYRQYKEKIDKLLGPAAEKSPCVGGNFFITPQQYGLHNDADSTQDLENTLSITPLNHEKRKYTCWKNVIIPLWIGTPTADELDGGQICFFNQRHIDWAHVYNGGNHTKNIATIYKISTDYTELQFHDQHGNPIPKEQNNIPFDREIYDTYMNTPYDRLSGLSLENVFDWKPETLMSFDAVQLHNTNQGTKSKGTKTWTSKMGLLLTFVHELDDDLLIDWRKEQKKM